MKNQRTQLAGAGEAPSPHGFLGMRWLKSQIYLGKKSKNKKRKNV